MCWIYSYPGDAGPSSQWGQYYQYLNGYEMTLIALPIGHLAPLMFVIKSCHDTDLWIITASSRWLCIDDKYQYEVVGIHASPIYDMLHGIWFNPLPGLVGLPIQGRFGCFVAQVLLDAIVPVVAPQILWFLTVIGIDQGVVWNPILTDQSTGQGNPVVQGTVRINGDAERPVCTGPGVLSLNLSWVLAQLNSLRYRS